MNKTELTDMKITHISYVKKGANKKEFFLMKSDNDGTDFAKEVKVFVNKADKEQKLVYGIVYEPDEIDTQGEFAKADSIEKAAHSFLEDARNIDLQHNFKSDYGKVVESYIAPTDFAIGTNTIKKGSWVLATKATDDVWQSIKKGEITGYSMAGIAKRTEVKDDVKKDCETSSNDDFKGFFNLLKEFVASKKIDKADKETKSNTKGFAERIAVSDVMENMWRTTDTLTSTMRDILNDKDITDKQIELNKVVDEFSTYLKKKIAKVIDSNVTKADIDFFNCNEVEKAGKSISNANMQKINDAIEVLNKLKGIEQENKNDEEDDVEMKKEDLQEVMTTALKPITDRLDLIEKQHGETPKQESETKKAEDIMKEDMTKAFLEALEPINQRLSVIEKAKGMSKQSQEEPLKKSEQVFKGIQM